MLQPGALGKKTWQYDPNGNTLYAAVAADGADPVVGYS